jgi:hypothetical protein
MATALGMSEIDGAGGADENHLCRCRQYGAFGIKRRDGSGVFDFYCGDHVELADPYFFQYCRPPPRGLPMAVWRKEREREEEERRRSHESSPLDAPFSIPFSIPPASSAPDPPSSSSIDPGGWASGDW